MPATKLTLQATSFKRMQLNDNDEYLHCYFYAEIHGVPEELKDYNTNEEGLLSGEAEAEATLGIMLREPRMLHLAIEPISLLASEVSYDKKKQTVTISMNKNSGDGIYRGGALLDTILQHRNEGGCDQRMYVEFELFVGVDTKILEELSAQRRLCDTKRSAVIAPLFSRFSASQIPSRIYFCYLLKLRVESQSTTAENERALQTQDFTMPARSGIIDTRGRATIKENEKS